MKPHTLPVYDQTRDDRLRDEFAMAALTGILAARPYHGTRSDDATVFAAAAYTLADAMLKQREAS